MFKSEEIILQVNNLNMIYDVDLYKSNSLREQFIKIYKNPLKIFSSPKDKLHVLKNISFTIKKGEKVGIVGRNGSGKTTLCRCIANMFNPTDGEIKIKGKVRSIFDTHLGIIPELTGRENAYLLSKIIYPQLNRDETKQLVEEAIFFSEINEFSDAPFKTYSKGMQARLSLSLISSRPCDLLILDEVFDGADQFFQEKISKRITRLIEKSSSVIFISHSPDQILKTCNRLFFLNDGVITEDGSPEEILEVYSNLTHKEASSPMELF